MSKPEVTSQPESYPSANLRGAISLFLVFHLFALLVAITSNGLTSDLLRRLWRTPCKPYLQVLNMDLNYRFHHVYGDRVDMDWIVQAEVHQKDGTRQEIVIPGQSGLPLTSYDRRVRVARLLAQSDGNDEAQGILAQGLAGGLLTRLEEQGTPREQIDHLVLRCYGHRLPTRQQHQQGVDMSGSEFFENVYEARIIIEPGRPLVPLKMSSEGESAPAASDNESE